jgi:acetolactate synthase-1/2/3 large subunit
VGQHRHPDADLLIALGMRFDDRVAGTIATYAPTQRVTSRSIPPRSTNVHVDVGIVGDIAGVLAGCPPRRRAIGARGSRIDG